MFEIARIESNPVGIVSAPAGNKNVTEVDDVKLEGKWWRVIPATGKEVMALAMLAHREEKFAPLKGHGALICDAAMKMFRAGRKVRQIDPVELDEIFTPKLPVIERKRPTILSPAKAGMKK
jgi:hypothetical protein